MSVLTRLVARATGQAAPGLVPRLPGRFETAPGDWGVSLEVQESGLAVPPAPIDQPVPSMTQAAAQPTWAPAGEGGLEPSRKQLRPLASGRAVADEETPAPLPDAVPAGRGRSDAPRASEPTGPPPPKRAAASARMAAEDVERLGPAAWRAEAARAPSPMLPEVAVAPEPLLPEAPPPLDRTLRPDDPDRGQIQPVRPAPMTRAGRAAKAEPPEITIHIGRIDVVAGPQERKAPRRPQRRRPQMTALGDYLRGKERGG